jgi:hypothetical protein
MDSHCHHRLDNEYSQHDFGEEGAMYFAQLEEAYRSSGIVVPLTYNDPGQLKNFVNGTVSFQPFRSF